MKKVISAKANDDFTLDLQFNDGAQKRFDVKPYLEYKVFKELKNLDYFKRIKIAFGTVQWQNDQDFSAETLYLESAESIETVTHNAAEENCKKPNTRDIEIINRNADLINKQVEETLEFQAEW